jgi:hypothetical protein
MTDQPRIYVDAELFLGRVDEQDRFRDALRAVQRGSKAVEKVKDWFADNWTLASPKYGGRSDDFSRLSRHLWRD